MKILFKGENMKSFKKILTFVLVLMVCCLPLLSLTGCSETNASITLNKDSITVQKGDSVAKALNEVKISYSSPSFTKADIEYSAIDNIQYKEIEDNGIIRKVVDEEKSIFKWTVTGFFTGDITTGNPNNPDSKIRTMTITYRGCSATLRYTVTTSSQADN